MHNTRVVAFLIVGCAGGSIACESDPSGLTDVQVAATVAASLADGGMGPFLIELADQPEPALLGCAEAVNNEGMNSEVQVEDADGTGFSLPSTAQRGLTNDPVRMNRFGDVMATYWLDPD